MSTDKGRTTPGRVLRASPGRNRSDPRQRARARGGPCLASSIYRVVAPRERQREQQVRRPRSSTGFRGRRRMIAGWNVGFPARRGHRRRDHEGADPLVRPNSHAAGQYGSVDGHYTSVACGRSVPEIGVPEPVGRFHRRRRLVRGLSNGGERLWVTRGHGHESMLDVVGVNVKTYDEAGGVYPRCDRAGLGGNDFGWSFADCDRVNFLLWVWER